MSKFKSFFKSNAKEAQLEFTFVPSDRFVDEEGNTIPFKLRVLSSKEMDKIRAVSMDYSDPKNPVFKQDALNNALMVASVVEPDLMDAELQDSYGVKTPVDLLAEMLTGPESTKLLVKVQDINGLREDYNSLVKEVKN